MINNFFQNHPFFWVLIFFLIFITLTAASNSADESRDYIVFTDPPPHGQDLRDYALQILTSLLRSKQDAEEALIYVYRNVGPGFSARLTPQQASRLQNQPGVLYVKESELLEPDPGPGGALSS